MLVSEKIPIKNIFNKVKSDAFRVLLISSLFHLLKLFFGDYLPSIPLQLPTVLGTSISLILAFRINQSYDRWWEARKVWGAIVNDSRSLVLQLYNFISDSDPAKPGTNSFLQKITYRQIAWCYSLGQSLRGLDPVTNIKNFISSEEIKFLQTQSNKPFALLALHTQDLQLLHQKK